MCHNVLKAHGAAVIAIRENAKQPVKIGYAPTCGAMFPSVESKENIEATRQKYFSCPPISREVMWNVSWWSDPIVLGHYPEDGLKAYKEYLPKGYPGGEAIAHQWNQSREDNMQGQFHFYYSISKDTISRSSMFLYVMVILMLSVTANFLFEFVHKLIFGV